MFVVNLEGGENVRDLGGTPAVEGKIIKAGLFYRGASLHNITETDQRELFTKRGIQTVIDLRTGWERAAKPDKLPHFIEDIHNPFYDLEIVGIEYTKSVAGTKAEGKDIACDPDDYYRSLTNPLTVGQMSKACKLVFERICAGKPVYIHCSGGKDRAGIFTLLMLYILGVSQEDILEDYLFTNVSRDKNITEVYERFLRLSNGNEEIARELTNNHRARPENIAAFYEALHERYGSMESFIEKQLGISKEERKAYITACCC